MGLKYPSLMRCPAIRSVTIFFPKTEAEQSSELLWNWRVSVFAPYLELFTERVALEKQELITHLGMLS